MRKDRLGSTQSELTSYSIRYNR